MSVMHPKQVTVLLSGIHRSRVSKDPRGYSHVEAWDIRAMLNRVFGFGMWSLTETAPPHMIYDEPTKTKEGKPARLVAYRASLVLTICHDGGTADYAGSAVGEATMPEYMRGDAHDMALKTAESQALKRCATNLGDQFGLSMYRDGSVEPVVVKTWTGDGWINKDGELT